MKFVWDFSENCKSFRKPADCFMAIVLEVIGKIKNETAAAMAKPVKKVSSRRLTNDLEAAMFGKCGAYVDATKVNIAYTMVGTISCGRFALM
jgi:hypothetical protein